MIEQLIAWDKSLLLYLNGMHTSFWDFMMYWISEKFTWIPFYLFLIFLVYRKYKIQTLVVILFAAALITISDQISVMCFKDVFERLRPCHDPVIGSMVYLVKGECGGLYGFVSGHAANTFALCFFIIGIIGERYKFLKPGMIIWAAVVSYSRIYLGAHYPLDVLCGAIVGILVGFFVGKAFNWYYNKFVLKKAKQNPASFFQ